MKKPILLFLLSFSTIFGGSRPDLTVVGKVMMSQGIGKIAPLIMECASGNLKVNYINTRPKEFSLMNASHSVASICRNTNKKAGKVAVFTDVLWNGVGDFNYTKMPKDCIRFAYTMLESSEIPHEWVTILNTHFDGVIVPIPSLVQVYKKCGVKLPIFVVPLPVDDYRHATSRAIKKDIFTFGSIAGFGQRKNFRLLIEAFHKAFGNDPKMALTLHGNLAFGKEYQNIVDLIEALGAKNITLDYSNFNQKEYIAFLRNMDAYVLLSKGEGYSFVPREAMLLKIPCVLSNNTGHLELCKNPSIIGVPSNIQEPAFYENLGNRYLGYELNCTVDDAAQALKEMYNNYEHYKSKTDISCAYIEQFLIKNIRSDYISLFKPKKVLLGDQNIITHDYLMTNSKKLYDAYKKHKIS